MRNYASSYDDPHIFLLISDSRFLYHSRFISPTLFADDFDLNFQWLDDSWCILSDVSFLNFLWKSLFLLLHFHMIKLIAWNSITVAIWYQPYSYTEKKKPSNQTFFQFSPLDLMLFALQQCISLAHDKKKRLSANLLWISKSFFPFPILGAIASK